MKKKVAGILLAGVILLSGSASFAQASANTDSLVKVQFTDITNHWAKDAVQYLLIKNSIAFGEDKFYPGKAITRSEFALMLHKSLGIQIAYFKAPDIKDYYNDVEQNAPYASAVIDLVTANIFEGKGNFNPEATITREEMVHYIIQAYKYKLGETYALIKIGAATFTDTSAININYSGEVALAQHYKLVSGSSNNMFYPQKAATRAEALTVIYKLVTLAEKQDRQVTVSPEAVVTNSSIKMKISIKNSSDREVVINHGSGQKFDFALLDADRDALYTWSADKMFTMALTNTLIKPGETLELGDSLSGEECKKLKDKAVYLQAYIAGKSDDFNINPDGYSVKISK